MAGQKWWRCVNRKVFKFPANCCQSNQNFIFSFLTLTRTFNNEGAITNFTISRLITAANEHLSRVSMHVFTRAVEGERKNDALTFLDFPQRRKTCARFLCIDSLSGVHENVLARPFSSILTFISSTKRWELQNKTEFAACIFSAFFSRSLLFLCLYELESLPCCHTAYFYCFIFT